MAKIPPARRSLTGEIRKDREQVRRQRNSSPFFGTGMHPNGLGGIDSDNFVEGESGYRFSDDGNAEFNDLTLRGGIIGNDALTEPVVPYVAHGEANNFTVSTTLTTKASVTVTVPAGYTRAMVSAVASASAYNPTASSDYIYVSAWIAGDTSIGYAIPSTCPANDSGASTQAASALLTGLTGSFTVEAAVASAYVDYTTSTGGNVCNIDATVLFLR